MLFRSFTYRFAVFAVMSSLLLGTGSSTSSAQEAAEMVDQAARTMLELDSFHFSVTTELGKTLLSEQIELTGIEGDVLRPDAFRAEFTVELGFASLDLSAIGIGSSLWVSDPISGNNQYIELSGEGLETLPPRELLNPDRLVMLAVSLLKDSAIKGDDEINDRPVINIEGTLDPRDLEQLGTPVPEELLSDIEPLTVDLWIDEEHRIVRTEFAGALLPSERDAGPLVRRIELSAFNEPLTIEAPGVQA